MLEEFSKLESEDASSEEAKKALEYKETCRKDDRAPRESMVNNECCTERTQLSVVILVLYASLTTYKRFMTRMTIQVAVAAAEKLPLGQSTAGTRKQYMWVVPSTFQVKTKKPPKLEDLFFLSHFFSLSLSLSFFSVSSIQHRIS